MKILATSLLILQQLSNPLNHQPLVHSWTIEVAQNSSAASHLVWKVTEQSIGVVCPQEDCFVVYTGLSTENHQAECRLNHLIKRELDKKYKEGYGLLKMEYMESDTTLTCTCSILLFANQETITKSFSYSLTKNW